MEAEQLYRQILSKESNHAQATHMLGVVAYNVNRLEVAEQWMRRALSLDPQLGGCYGNLGLVLAAQGRDEEAISAYRKAIELLPNLPEAYNSLGNALQSQGEFQAAEECFRNALKIRPGIVQTHWNLAKLLLLQGKYQEGWQEYAWRTQLGDFNFVRKDFAQPQWDGKELRGKTILINTEQGFGDNIQFIRYLPMVRDLGAKILLGCQPELIRLFRGQFKIDQWVLASQRLPDFHVHSPLLSLPMVFRTRLDSIPARVPYLFPEGIAAERWKDRLTRLEGRRVGIAWAGKPTHLHDRNRSIELPMLSPLAQVPGISFVSLQAGEAARQPAGEMRLNSWTDDLQDFAETAALIANLELVITVDTAIAHLAGAMGKPVWVLLPFVPDWRWLLARTDSPWYPTMRLFRQKQAGDWTHPLEQVVQSLHDLIKGNG